MFGRVRFADFDGRYTVCTYSDAEVNTATMPHATLRVSPTLEEDWVLIARGGQADCYALT